MTGAARPGSGQPYLHELVSVLRGPALALSGRDGQLRPDGAHGIYWSDRRVLSALEVTVDGRPPEALRTSDVAVDEVRFTGTIRGLGDLGPDPSVLLERVRQVRPRGATETLRLVSYARLPARAIVEVHAACDLAEMARVKSGAPSDELAADQIAGGLQWQAPDGTRVSLVATPEPVSTSSEPAVLRWPIHLRRGEPVTIRLDIGVWDESVPAPTTGAAGGASPIAAPDISTHDHRLTALVARSVADLDGLLLTDPLEPSDHFLAAGAPWFLTLFGRDSLWAARMLLPLGTAVAGGTLRTLARRQGRRVDPGTAEEPGKILHEVRRPVVASSAPDGDRPSGLPVPYYGTVDATSLWISLLHDAWRWGMCESEVRELIPATERALDWLAAYGMSESGFVSYHDVTGQGLANQGWKDSGDSVQFRNGEMASAPIALCEVQAYAYAAARQGADLLDAFGRPGAPEWRRWAAALAERFRDSFWTEDPAGRYPAIALDAEGARVDAVTSNIGHLLGTGLLDAAEERLVADRLAGPDLDSGFGVRTMSTTSAGFNPLGYHAGTVWTHDTAIAIAGLAGTPYATTTAHLIRGLLAAASGFDYRLPELFGGQSADELTRPCPYPAACRPQAWSAATSVVLLSTILGVRPDVPGGVLRLAPMRPSPVGALTVRNLRLRGERLDVHLSGDGEIDVLTAPSDLRIEIS
jgi:glycogen debranching enzyme